MKITSYHIDSVPDFFIHIIVPLIFFAGTYTLQAVGNRGFDTKGTDFWLTFPPNFHNWVNGNPDYEFNDSLYIFITSDEPTSGVIEYTDVNGNNYSRNFNITDPAQVYNFDLYYLDFELPGFNNSGLLGDRAKSEVISHICFHITSDKEVTVYAHNQAQMTSDACLVFPTDILGKDYFVMAYNSDGSYSQGFGVIGSSTPSQFAVIATQDNTNVTIKPSDDTEYNGKNVQTIILNKGDTYLVQAGISKNNLTTDLTGSEIQSDKPIAVFAGQQRANIPVETDSSTSRDYLLEEMPPIGTWGKNALLVPYVQPPFINPEGNDLFRILAANDNTKININGLLIATLNKGQYYEGNLTQSGYVTASAPILVSQFKKSSGFRSGAQATPLSDPFEMLIPPVEQFMTDYRIVNVQAYELSTSDNNYVKVYSMQYVTIVAPDTALQSVLLDSVNVPVNRFTSMPSSGFSYANIQVSDGVHTINADAKVGVYVYGYGAANSYGYVGGMSMKILDTKPPKFVSIDSCIYSKGVKEIYMAISDSTFSDYGLMDVEIVDSTNCSIEIDNHFPLYENIKITVKDPYKDAIYDIIATDSNNFKSEVTDTIPGFTISLPVLESGYNEINFGSIIIGKSVTQLLKMTNTGNRPITFDKNIYLSNNIIFSIPPSQLPFTLNPGETKDLIISFNPILADTAIFRDTLNIEYNCLNIKITLEGKGEPIIQDANSQCNITVRFSTDSLPVYSFLNQSYPNPTSGITTIGFGVSNKSTVNIRLYDLFGNQVVTILNEKLKPGIYEIHPDFKSLANGIYVCVLISGLSVFSRSIVVQK